jgi:hypothetical protein
MEAVMEVVAPEPEPGREPSVGKMPTGETAATEMRASTHAAEVHATAHAASVHAAAMHPSSHAAAMPATATTASKHR